MYSPKREHTLKSCTDEIVLAAHQMDGSFRLFDNAQVVVVGAELARLLQVDPDVAVDFLLLYPHVIGERAREEEHHALADFAEGTILADFAEIVHQRHIQPCFLPDFADGGFLLGFALLDMSLGKLQYLPLLFLTSRIFTFCLVL